MAEGEARKVGIRLVADDETFPYTIKGTEIVVQLRRLNDAVRTRLKEQAGTIPNPMGASLPPVPDDEKYADLCTFYIIADWDPEQFLNGVTGKPTPCTDEAKAKLPDHIARELFEATRSDAANFILSPVADAEANLKAEGESAAYPTGA